MRREQPSGSLRCLSDRRSRTIRIRSPCKSIRRVAMDPALWLWLARTWVHFLSWQMTSKMTEIRMLRFMKKNRTVIPAPQTKTTLVNHPIPIQSTAIWTRVPASNLTFRWNWGPGWPSAFISSPSKNHWIRRDTSTSLIRRKKRTTRYRLWRTMISKRSTRFRWYSRIGSMRGPDRTQRVNRIREEVKIVISQVSCHQWGTPIKQWSAAINLGKITQIPTIQAHPLRL